MQTANGALDIAIATASLYSDNAQIAQLQAASGRVRAASKTELGVAKVGNDALKIVTTMEESVDKQAEKLAQMVSPLVNKVERGVVSKLGVLASNMLTKPADILGMMIDIATLIESLQPNAKDATKEADKAHLEFEVAKSSLRIAHGQQREAADLLAGIDNQYQTKSVRLSELINELRNEMGDLGHTADERTGERSQFAVAAQVIADGEGFIARADVAIDSGQKLFEDQKQRLRVQIGASNRYQSKTDLTKPIVYFSVRNGRIEWGENEGGFRKLRQNLSNHTIILVSGSEAAHPSEMIDPIQELGQRVIRLKEWRDGIDQLLGPLRAVFSLSE
jgi:hypothetical protein